MNTIQSLEKLGLTQTEASIYLLLANNGPLKSPQIQTALELNKVAAYRALSTLASKGLISSAGDKRLQTYSAEPLQKLLVQYDRNIQELNDARIDLEKLIASLSDRQNELYRERNIQIFEGLEGFRLWLDQRLNTDDKLIREFGHNLFWLNFSEDKKAGKTMTLGYMHKRMDKGIKLRSIFTSGEDLPSHARSREDFMKESRYLSMPSLPTLIFSIFGSKIGFYSQDKDIFRGVIIDDRVLSALMKLVFDNLWSQAKPVNL